MDWTNDMVLEFLQVFKAEPVIWDPKHPEHKKKQALGDAWRRIHTDLNWQNNIDDLKKKRESLMAYYRQHLIKIRKMKNSGIDDYHRTINWFAFDTMHSFLGSIYDPVCSTEDAGVENVRFIPESTDSANCSECLSDTEYQPPRKRRQVPETFAEIATTAHLETSHVAQEIKECEMYGQLLIHKLMKLEEDDRLTLMNKIDNLVFQTTMEIKMKKKLDRLRVVNVTSINQTPRSNTDRDGSPVLNDYTNVPPSPSYLPCSPVITNNDISQERNNTTPNRANISQSRNSTPSRGNNLQSSTSIHNLNAAIKRELLM